jgi:hypothetical protein
VAKKRAHSKFDHLPGKASRRVFDGETFNCLAAAAVAVPPNKIFQPFRATFTTCQTLIPNESRLRQIAEEPDWDHSFTLEIFTTGRILQ